jgi:hypothetical protein
MSAVCLFSLTSRGSVAWASVRESDETCIFGFFGQVQPRISGRTFAIRVASAGVNVCSSALPPQPPMQAAATIASAPRLMASVAVGGHSPPWPSRESRLSRRLGVGGGTLGPPNESGLAASRSGVATSYPRSAKSRATASVRVLALSFSKMCSRCVRTV